MQGNCKTNREALDCFPALNPDMLRTARFRFRRRLGSHHLNPGVAKFVTPGFSLAPIPSPTPSPETIANPHNGLRFREGSLFPAETRRGATFRFGLPACARKSLVSGEPFLFGLWHVSKLTSGLWHSES